MKHLKLALWVEGENWFTRCFKRPKHDWKWNLVNTVWPIRLVSCSLRQFQWFCMHARYVRCQKVFPGLKNWIAVPFQSYANFRGHTEVFTMCKGKGIQHMSRFSQLVCILCSQVKQAEEVKGANPWFCEWKDGAECGMESRRMRYHRWKVIFFLSSPWACCSWCTCIPTWPEVNLSLLTCSSRDGWSVWWLLYLPLKACLQYVRLDSNITLGNVKQFISGFVSLLCFAFPHWLNS